MAEMGRYGECGHCSTLQKRCSGHLRGSGDDLGRKSVRIFAPCMIVLTGETRLLLYDAKVLFGLNRPEDAVLMEMEAGHKTKQESRTLCNSKPVNSRYVFHDRTSAPFLAFALMCCTPCEMTARDKSGEISYP